MTEAIKFNIGGQRYDVSRSLLDKHPESMLARSASAQWQEDPEAEIFIERDGFRFRYILDYLRDDKLALPGTESRETIISELEYYGVKVNEKYIVDSMVDVTRILEGDISSTGELHFAAKVAHGCIGLWFTRSHYLTNEQNQITFNALGYSTRDQFISVFNKNPSDAAIFDNLVGLHKYQSDVQKKES
eukprot:CAMPEP_0194110624 /NCGR_PEP_ID=MMETSP0150-20130528/9830_1 /TAXON_ID=122233 /ORGANISM="Chaetoceros debilis, Strain MM31A-1" /LENGTH=187 /DNA_ID=CAMNT_0038799853 /DNA_START=556 /DNA_END=1116 /DNA_ORIENTATION=+